MIRRWKQGEVWGLRPSWELQSPPGRGGQEWAAGRQRAAPSPAMQGPQSGNVICCLHILFLPRPHHPRHTPISAWCPTPLSSCSWQIPAAHLYPTFGVHAMDPQEHLSWRGFHLLGVAKPPNIVVGPPWAVLSDPLEGDRKSSWTFHVYSSFKL